MASGLGDPAGIVKDEHVTPSGCGPGVAHAIDTASVNIALDSPGCGDVAPPLDCVGISIHSRGVGTAAIQADIGKMLSILDERFQSRQCVASSAIVLLQDGVYVPWKKRTEEYNVWQLTKWRWFAGMDLRYVCHEKQWATAGPGSTHLDAERAISTGPLVTGPPTPLMKSRRPPGRVPLMPLCTTIAPDVPQAECPRSMLTLDLIGHVDDTSKDQALRKRCQAFRYDRVQQQLGEGSFGQVYSCESTVGLRAVKKLKIQPCDTVTLTKHQHCDTAVVEVSVLERCARCPHIITLLDVCKCGPHICLIFELWGKSLFDLKAENSGFGTAPHLRMVFEQSLKALLFLHSVDVIHTDIKTANVLVLLNTGAHVLTCDSASSPLHLKLADFGSCLVVDPKRRPHINAQSRSFRHEMRNITTVPYRAPEIVFGNQEFGTAIDLWALGIMMCSLTAWSFTHESQPQDDKPILSIETRLVAAWRLHLGPPCGEELVELRAFPYWHDFHSPGLDSPMAARPAPRRVRDLLGGTNFALVLRLLSWVAQGRGSAASALGEGHFHPERLTHALPSPGESYTDPSTCSFTGVRHLWNVKEGEVSPEICLAIMGDVADVAEVVRREFFPDHSKQLTFGKHCAVAQLENATKYTIAGWLVAGAQGGRLNGMNISKKLPFAEVRRWRNALMIANAEAIEEFWANLKTRLASLSGELGPSGDALSANHPNSWLWAVAETHITHRHFAQDRVAKRRKCKGAPPQLKIEERLHNDGAASGLHIGLTGAGKRKVRFLQEEVQVTTTKESTPVIADDVVLRCYPGHVYVGGVTGARHQVIQDDFEDEAGEALLNLPMGPCSMTFMLRSCIFPDRSRTKDVTPNPRNVWHCFTSCAREFIHDPRFRLPTIAEFLQAPDE